MDFGTDQWLGEWEWSKVKGHNIRTEPEATSMFSTTHGICESEKGRNNVFLPSLSLLVLLHICCYMETPTKGGIDGFMSTERNESVMDNATHLQTCLMQFSLARIRTILLHFTLKTHLI